MVSPMVDGLERERETRKVECMGTVETMKRRNGGGEWIKVKCHGILTVQLATS